MLKGFNKLDLYIYTLTFFRRLRCKSTYYYGTGSLYNKYFHVYLQSIIFWILISQIITQWSHNVWVVFLHGNMDTYYYNNKIHRRKVYWLSLIFFIFVSLNLVKMSCWISLQFNGTLLLWWIVWNNPLLWSKNIKNPLEDLWCRFYSHYHIKKK